ncbi:chloride channel protein [soil metagenome]
MNFSKISSLRKEFDFRLAGRWLLFGLAVGVISGLGAILFQTILEIVKEVAITHWMGISPGHPGGENETFKLSLANMNPWLVVLIPALGGLLTGFIVFKFAPEAEGHGTDEAIKAFHRKRGFIRPIVPIVKFFASIITIGTGGSGGREGPIAQIGAGFGSFLATKLHLNTKTRRWLLAAGMGAGIGCIFRAPLAGAIFAAEVLYSSAEVEAEVLLPATVSSIIAYSVYSFRFGWEHIFTNAGGHGFSNPLELIPYTIEALVLVLGAFIFVKVFYGIRKLFSQWKFPNMLKPVIGGLLTGGLALLLIKSFNDQKYVVNVMGGGYGILQEIFQNGISHIGLTILLIVAAGKILTTSFTIGSGGSAGVFGPSMVIGGTLGAASGYMLQFIFPGIPLDPGTFAIVGMAGFFAAAANTPLSTIIMVSELTGNYELLMPSMWVCSISYLLARRWSIYQSQVPGKLYSQAHFGEYAYDIFETTYVKEALKKTRRCKTAQPESTMEEVMGIVRETSQRIFPVVDENNIPVGYFNMVDVTHTLQEEDGLKKNVKDIMHKVGSVAHPDDTIGKAQQLMIDHQLEELMVIDEHGEKPILTGIITAADIIMATNRKLSEIRFGNEAESRILPEDQTVLNHITVKSVLEKDLLTIDPDANLGELVKIIIKSNRNLFPVVNSKKEYFGIIQLNDIRELMFDTSKYTTVLAKELLKQSDYIVHTDEHMDIVMEKFEKTKLWNLPVVDRHNHFLGIVSRSTIFSVYRKQLLHQV